MSALVSLSIKHLRGATSQFELKFDKSKKLTVLYGENASGKSTICDALEMLGSGNVGSLDDRGLGRTERYWPTLGRAAKDIEVVLTSTTGSHTAKVSASGVSVLPPADRPLIQVLRRSQILSLILATESARYKEIAEFIDVQNVETAENELKRSVSDTEADVKTAQTRLGENQAAIERLASQGGYQGTDAIGWARKRLSARTAAPEGQVISALGGLILAFDRLDEQILKAERTADARRSAQADVEAAEKALQIAKSNAGGDGETIRVLEAVDQTLNGADPESCPVCGSKENVAGLGGAVREKIAGLRALSAAQRDYDRAVRSVAASEDEVMSVRKAATEAAETLGTALSDSGLPGAIGRPQEFPSAEPGKWMAWLQQARVAEQTWKAARDESEGQEQLTEAVRGALEQLDRNVVFEKQYSDLLPKLKAAYAAAVEERRTYVDKLLDAISIDVARLYERVHPREGLSTISLAMNPKTRASLQMRADFEGTSGNQPQAYFSDSHLDTLGLCIFVALAKRSDAREKVLVLDDVLGSVDEPHVDRLIEMIYDEAQGFRHVVITTHYRPWREKYRWGHLNNGEIQFVELAQWSSAQGILEANGVPAAIETLREQLAATPPNKLLICAPAGVALEALLTFIVKKYRCRVPVDDGSGLTVGDLLQGFDTKLRSALRSEIRGADAIVETPLAPLIEEIENVCKARNVLGAHFNDVAGHLGDNDAVGFGTAVLKLADAIVDPEHGWPTSDRSGSHWSNSKDTRRLHPLKRPS